MEKLIIDDRTSPDQKIRDSSSRRHEKDRRHNPFKGKIHRDDEHREEPEGRREEVRRDTHKP